MPLDLGTVRIVVASHASFENAKGGRRQFGFVISMVDHHEKANEVHYASCRFRRVSRSVMAAEIYAVVTGYDFAFVIADMLHEIIGRTPVIQALVERRTLLDVVAKDGNRRKPRAYRRIRPKRVLP